MAPERKNVVERAEETSALLAAMVEGSDDAIVGEALNGKITYWNGAAERLFGFTAEEAVGRSGHFLTPRESISVDAELRARVAEGQRLEPFDAVRVCKDGSIVEVSVTLSPIRDATGRIVGTSRSMRDISARKATERELRRCKQELQALLAGADGGATRGDSDGAGGVSTAAERKRMEETLRESEERFRTLADNIAQLAWMADGRGFIFWYNKRWFEFTGTTLEEMQGWGWRKAHHPDHVGRVVEKIRHAFDTGEYWEDTFPLRNKDGHYRWFLSRAIPIPNAQGEVVRWMGTNTDITEQLEVEAELAAARDRAEESEKLFRAFVTASSDVVYRMSADWTVMRRLEGKDFIADTPDPTRSWLKTYIHPDDQARVLAAIGEAIRGKKIFELEHRVIRIDGALGWTFSRAIPLLDERGEITEWFGAALDITERKHAEAALQRLTEASEHQRRLYDTLLASTPDQICVFGLDRRFLYVNPALLRNLGLPREQVIGRSCAEAGFEPQQGACHDREVAEVVATRHPIRGEAIYAGADGRRIYDYLFVPVLGTAGNVEAVGGSMRDITDRKRIAENLERMVGERTAKLRETIGELEAFSYSIAHDMRAPLRSLQGYAEVLLAEHAARLDPEGKEYLARIGTAANRMDRLILDVLNYSRIVRSELRLERVHLDALIGDIVETYPMFAPDKADIEVARPLPTVLGNDAALTQVFSNLIGNAVKFTRPGLKPRIRIWCEFRGPFAKVSVQDNGIGIPADQHQKIFEVFQQAETGYGGTGIGLSIVKKAIERIGGEVGVWSEPGKGSTFWVEIPRAD